MRMSKSKEIKQNYFPEGYENHWWDSIAIHRILKTIWNAIIQQPDYPEASLNSLLTDHGPLRLCN